MKTFEEWWKESGGDNKELSPAVEAVANNIKKLCKQAFEAGGENGDSIRLDWLLSQTNKTRADVDKAMEFDKQLDHEVDEVVNAMK